MPLKFPKIKFQSQKEDHEKHSKAPEKASEWTMISSQNIFVQQGGPPYWKQYKMKEMKYSLNHIIKS